MGNKGTKEQVDQLLQLTDDKGRSRQELVGCLASIADMANTGHGAPLPSGAAGGAGGVGAPTAPPEELLKANSKLRRRLESLKGNGDDLQMIENLLGEDTQDWAHMRSWLVWCMHDNLDEKSDDSPPASANKGRHLRRQSSMDVVKSRLTVQQNFELNPRDERNMSNQSSMESNAET